MNLSTKEWKQIMKTRLILDINKTQYAQLNSLVTGRVGDKASNTVDVYVVDGFIPYNLTGSDVYFECAKPDNTSVRDKNGITMIDAAKGHFEYTFPTQTFASVGKSKQAYFTVEKNSTVKATTQDFIIVSLPNALTNRIPSKTYISQLEELIWQLEQIQLDLLNSEAYREAHDAKEFAEQANELSINIQKQLNEIVINGDSSVEAAQARVDPNGITYPTLKERIDVDSNKIGILSNDVSEQAQQLKDIHVPFKGYENCIISFVDDDGRNDFLTNLKPIYDEKGIKGSLAITTAKTGTSGYLTVDQLKTLQNEGYEIVSHGHTHATLSDLSDTDAIKECVLARDFLKNNGFKGHDIFVYPNGVNKTDVRTKNIVKQYYKCGVATDGDDNIAPMDTYCLDRLDMETRTLADSKAEVDLAISKKKWLIFMTHGWMRAYADPARQQLFRDLIDYIKSKNVPIVTIDEGLKMKGNAIEIGDKSANTNYLYISNTGKSESNVDNNGMVYNAIDGDLTKLPSSYKKGKTTVSNHWNGATGLPGAYGGTLLTFRDVDDAYTKQLFIENVTTTVYVRRWSTGSSSWQSWTTVNYTGTMITKDNVGSSFDASITTYTKGSVTFSRFTGAGAGATAPTPNVGGVLKTHRFVDTDDTYSYQEWQPRTSPLKTWRRFWNVGGNTWGAWEQ